MEREEKWDEMWVWRQEQGFCVQTLMEGVSREEEAETDLISK